MVNARLFWLKVDRASGNECWHWTAAKSHLGYGRFGVGKKKTKLAHHVSFFLTNGKWPTYLLHKCDTPSCVNPSHLAEGDQVSNVRDMIVKGRRRIGTLQKKNSVHVPRIRDLLRCGCRVGQIAKWLNVSHPVVSNVKNGTHKFKFLDAA